LGIDSIVKMMKDLRILFILLFLRNVLSQLEMAFLFFIVI